MRYIEHLSDVEQLHTLIRSMGWVAELPEIESFWRWFSDSQGAGWLDLRSALPKRADLHMLLMDYEEEKQDGTIEHA